MVALFGRSRAMKRFALALATPLLAGACLPPPTQPTTWSHAPIVVVNGDRFTGALTIETTPAAALGHLEAAYAARFADPHATQLQSAQIVLHAAFDNWHYLNCHGVSMLIDGARVPHIVSEHHGDVDRNGVYESIRFPINAEIVDHLARAQLVEFKVCNDEFRVDPALAREFGCKVNQQEAGTREFARCEEWRSKR